MVVSPKEERGAGGILVARYLFIQARLSVDSRFFLGFSVTLSGSFFSFFFFFLYADLLLSGASISFC